MTLFFLVWLFPSLSFADENALLKTRNSFCASIEVKTTLTGNIEILTLPGPPNYEDIAKGDKPEQVLLLQLPIPICISVETRTSKEKVAHGVTEIQLAGNKKITDKLKNLTGRPAQVTGKLFEAFTGHHHRHF